MAYEKQPEEEKYKGPALCEWNDHGMSCGYRGILSPGTAGGPWYCREHFYKLRGYWDADKYRGNNLIDAPLHSFAVDEMAAKLKLHREIK